MTDAIKPSYHEQAVALVECLDCLDIRDLLTNPHLGIDVTGDSIAGIFDLFAALAVVAPSFPCGSRSFPITEIKDCAASIDDLIGWLETFISGARSELQGSDPDWTGMMVRAQTLAFMLRDQ